AKPALPPKAPRPAGSARGKPPRPPGRPARSTAGHHDAACKPPLILPLSWIYKMIGEPGPMTSLSLRPDEPNEPARRAGRGVIAIPALLLVLVAGRAMVGYWMLQRMRAAERQVADLSQKADEAMAVARQATERAAAAESSARKAAEGRQAAE